MFKVLKEKKPSQSRILYLAKLAFKSEGKILSQTTLPHEKAEGDHHPQELPYKKC